MDVQILTSFLKSGELHAMVPVIIGSTKVLRNALGTVKGKYAVVVTLGCSVVTGIFFFSADVGYLFSGIGGLVAGLEGAGVFALSKFVGKKNPVAIDKQ